MSEFPPPGSDFEEEEEEHEDETGGDVEDDTQRHVHAVKTHAQDPHSTPTSSPSNSFSSLLLVQSLVSGFMMILSSYSSSLLLLRWSQGVPGGEVGDAVVVTEEDEHVVLVPDVDTIFLLVTGGAEGGARPWSFREEGVITERT